GTAVNPHHHRLAVTAGDIRRRPDVERQAVVALWRAEVDRDPGFDGLRTDRPEYTGIGDLGPRLGRLRRAPPEVAGRWGGVAHPLPRGDGTFVDATDRAVHGLHNGAHPIEVSDG